MRSTNVQVCFEDLSVHVSRGASMVGSLVVSVKPCCTLGYTWVTQSRRHWADNSQAFSSLRLRSLKPVIAVSLILPTVASG